MTTAIPVILKDTAGNYVLPQSYQIKATAETLGSIRVGSGLNMANDGVLSTTATTMTGATSSSAGTSGFVPAPAAGDQDKFLKGDGTYATPEGIKNQRSDGPVIKTWTGTQAQWDDGVVTDWRKWSTKSVESWTQSTLPSSARWRSVTYGNGKFVAVAYNSNEAAYSTDGVTWTTATLPSRKSWQSVTNGDGKFVIVSDGSNAAYSSDGIDWTSATLPSSATWYSITYGDGKFVAVAWDSDAFVYSEDGVTWTTATLPSSSNWRSVTYGNNKFVAVAYNSNKAAYSTDGVTWTTATLPSSARWYSVTYGNGKFVAVTYNSNEAAYSTDGIDWTAATLPSSANWWSVTYGNNKFVAVADGSNEAAYSTDGVTWTAATLPSRKSWRSVTYGNNKFVAVADGSNEAAVLTISQSNAFTTTVTPTTSDTVYSIPETESQLTITSVGDNSITLSDNQVYNRNAAGDEQTSMSIGEAHPDYSAYITDSKKLMLGNTEIANVSECHVADVKVDGTSVVTDGVANIDLSEIRSGASLGSTAVQPEDLATVATSGSYNDLLDKPSIPTKTSDLTNDSNYITSSYHDNSKQDTLVSGTNIKTINSNSILGSGNISIETSIDNTTITKNGSNNLQSVATIDNRSGNAIKTWTGTRAQYDAITTKDSNTLYNITDDTDVSLTILEALYPVGAIYIGTMEVCPLTVLGIGTWAKVSEGRVLQGSDNGHNAGTTIEAGLPNIIATGIAYEGSISPTGAVYKTSGGSCPSSTYQVRNTWNFDASLSNPIYGNSTTVQPSAFVVNIWKRIA